MSRRLNISDALVVKLASLAVHVEEFLNETDCGDADADLAAMKALLLGPEVREFLDHPRNAALLPVKRSNRTVVKFVQETTYGFTPPGAPGRTRKTQRKK